MWIFGPPNIEKAKANKDIKGLIRALGYLKDRNVRYDAARVLGEIGDAWAVEPLCATLKDEDESVRKAAAVALGDIRDPSAVGSLFEALKREQGGGHNDAAMALWMIGKPGVDRLIAALKDEDESVCMAAAVALGEIGHRSALEPLITALKDESPHLRKVAAEGLGKLGDPSAVEHLLATLKDKEWLVSDSAARALGKIGKRGIDPLAATLTQKGEELHVRQDAAKTLKKMGKLAVESLIVVLTDGDDDRNVRKACAEALRDMYLTEGLDIETKQRINSVEWTITAMIKDDRKEREEPSRSVGPKQSDAHPDPTAQLQPSVSQATQSTVSPHRSEETVLYAFFAQAASQNLGMLGASKGGVIFTHPLDEWKDKIREETHCPGMEVVIVPFEEWDPPSIRSFSQSDLMSIFPQVMAQVQRAMSKLGLPHMSSQQLIKEGLLSAAPPPERYSLYTR